MYVVCSLLCPILLHANVSRMFSVFLQIVSESAVRQVKEEVRIQDVCGHHPFIVGTIARWQTKKRLYIGKQSTEQNTLKT